MKNLLNPVYLCICVGKLSFTVLHGRSLTHPFLFVPPCCISTLSPVLVSHSVKHSLSLFFQVLRFLATSKNNNLKLDNNNNKNQIATIL